MRCSEIVRGRESEESRVRRSGRALRRMLLVGKEVTGWLTEVYEDVM